MKRMLELVIIGKVVEQFGALVEHETSVLRLHASTLGPALGPLRAWLPLCKAKNYNLLLHSSLDFAADHGFVYISLKAASCGFWACLGSVALKAAPRIREN